MNKDRIKTAVLEQVRAAAGSEGPVVAVDLPLGATGFAADLAILDDEFIGVVVADAADAVRDLSRRLEITSHYFERVVLIAAPDRLPDLGPGTLSGATVWTHDRDGRLVEHDPGTGNRVGLNARFDLLRMDERRYFLGELVLTDGAEPRGAFTAPAPRTRALFGMVFTARYGQASAAFWATTAGRPIAPDDLALLVGQAEPRDATRRERRRAAA
jgi:hypothetical protein